MKLLKLLLIIISTTLLLGCQTNNKNKQANDPESKIPTKQINTQLKSIKKKVDPKPIAKITKDNSDIGNIEISASKTPIRDFVKEYLGKKMDQSYEKNRALNLISINLSQGNLIIKLPINDITPHENLNCYQKWNSRKTCIPRGEESFLKELESELIKKFKNIKYITFYKGETIVYQDGKYHDINIINMSNDGRYFEVYLMTNQPGPAHMCVFFDAKTGNCLYDSNYEFYNETNHKKRNIIFNNLRLKYKIDSNFDRTKSYIHEKIKINSDVSIATTQNSVGYNGSPCEKEDIECIINTTETDVFYFHGPTGIKINILNEKSNFTGFYGHPLMQGLFLITWWNWEAEEVFVFNLISQDLLDQKLSHLYNNVGMHYYDEKDYKKAINYFSKAININDQYAQAYFNLASTHSLLNEVDLSLKNLKKSIEIEPEKFIKKAKSDKDFDSIRENEAFISLVK